MLTRIITLALLLPVSVFCQSPGPVFIVNDNVRTTYVRAANEGMFIFWKGDKYGFMNKDQKVLIPAEFEFPDERDLLSASVFWKGRAMVKKEGKWSVIDKTGKRLSPELDGIDLWDYDLALNVFVLKRDVGGVVKFGVVSGDGRTIVPFDYEEAITLDSNLIVTKKPHPVIQGSWIFSLRDAKGKVLIPEGGGFDYHDNIVVYPSEKVVMATSVTDNVVYDFAMKELLRLPRTFDPSKSYRKEVLDKALGRATGYFTGGSGKEVREMTFHSISKGRVFFKNRYMLTGRDGKIGMLDLTGDVVMEPRYDFVFSGFDRKDMCEVGNRVNTIELWFKGYVDRNGKEVFTPEKSTPYFFEGSDVGVAWDPVTKMKGLKDRSGKWVLAPSFFDAMEFDKFGGFLAKTSKDGEWHYYDVKGKDYGPFGGVYRYGGFDDGGYAAVLIPDTSFRVGYLDRTMSGVIPDCKGGYGFSEGLAVISSKSTGKFGFTDSTGKMVIPCIFDYTSEFNQGIARVANKVNGKYLGGYIDATGKVILPLEYERIGRFQDGYGLVQTDQGYSYVDRAGKLRPAPSLAGQMFTEFSSGLAMGIAPGVNNMRIYTYFDNTFKVRFTLSAYDAFPCKGDVVVASLSPMLYSIFDRNGVKVRDLPTGLQGLDFFGDGKFGVKINGKWGFASEKGVMIIPPQYDSIGAFRDGYACVRSAGKWTVIDSKGNVLAKGDYDNILLGNRGVFSYFRNYDRKWGVRDISGRSIYNNLDQATAFFDGKGMIRSYNRYCIVRSPLAK